MKFAQIALKYFLTNPGVVERLTNHLLNALIEHVAPSTASALAGEASASPLVGRTDLTAAGLGSTSGPAISR
jgi:hypothetical protein